MWFIQERCEHLWVDGFAEGVLLGRCELLCEKVSFALHNDFSLSYIIGLDCLSLELLSGDSKRIVHELKEEIVLIIGFV